MATRGNTNRQRAAKAGGQARARQMKSGRSTGTKARSAGGTSAIHGSGMGPPARLLRQWDSFSTSMNKYLGIGGEGTGTTGTTAARKAGTKGRTASKRTTGTRGRRATNQSNQNQNQGELAST